MADPRLARRLQAVVDAAGARKTVCTFRTRRNSMSNTSKPLITVVGAASKQGRSVADALLDSGRYRVRALTRRRDSQPAQALAQRGAEIVVAPLQPGLQAALTTAMQGSAAAFLMAP